MRKFYTSWIQTLTYFWKHYPALHFACFFLIGIASYLFLPILFFSIPFFTRENFVKSLVLLSCGFLYFHLLSHPPIQPPLKGRGIFHIQEVKTYRSPFNSCLVYSGTLKSFQTETQTLHRLPCRIYLHHRKNRPLAHQDYYFPRGILIETAPHSYIFKPETWIPMDKTYSLAEKRFQLKEKIKAYVGKHYKAKREYALITALLTGQLENPLLAFQFGQVGLQHLLAISGFHFALLSVFLLFLLRYLMPTRAAAAVLLILLSIYFLYMGDAPSISRAWIGVSISLMGILLHFQPTALNALGLALLCALIAKPLILLQIGFQLSFAATLGILLFYKLFEQKLQTLLPKRSFEEAYGLRKPDQWGYLLAAYLRSILALNGAVLIFVLPILLFHFHKFPLLSLVYNLFFPLLFSGLMSLLFLALLFSPLHLFTKVYASFLLDLITYAPKRLMFYIRVPDFPLWILSSLLIGVFIWGIQARGQERISLK